MTGDPEPIGAEARRALEKELARLTAERDTVAATLAGEEERHVDGFLHVATRLGQHLAHLTGHRAGKLLLAADQDLGDAEEDLGALRCRRQAPAVERGLRGGNRIRGIVHRGVGEEADQVAGVGGIAVLEGAAGSGRDPAAANVVVKGGDGCASHAHDLTRSAGCSAATRAIATPARDAARVLTSFADNARSLNRFRPIFRLSR